MILLLLLQACFPAQPTTGTVRVLTYNVQGLPDVLSESPLPTNDRMTAISPLLEGFDLVGVQEDFDPNNHALLIEATSHPVQAWFDDKVSAQRVYGSGLTLLSRIGEQVEVHEEHYVQCNGLVDNGSDCLASKGFHILRLSIGPVEVDVYNTHHEAGGGDDDDAARASQVAQVLASMEDRSGDRAVIFMGDTNLRWTDPLDVDELQAYADAGLRDACTEMACAEEDHIDRIYVRDGTGLTWTVDSWARDTSFVLGEEPLSDHPPITAMLFYDLGK